MNRTSFIQKVLLIIFGLLLAAFILEVVLRLGGAVLLFHQEQASGVSENRERNFVIMCLGESTTAGGRDAYPAQLEEILNSGKEGKRFSVVNRGVAGTITTEILDRLEDNLDTYRPDMVIAMMGVNDGPNTPAYCDERPVALEWFFRNMRTFKLARLLRERIAYQLDEMSVRRLMNKETGLAPDGGGGGRTGGRNPLRIIPKSEADFIAMGDWYFDQDRWAEAAYMYTAALEINPHSASGLARLGACHREQGNVIKAKWFFSRAIAADPQNSEGYLELGNHYRGRRLWNEAQNLYRKAISVAPGNPRPYREWGMVAVGEGRFARAEQLFRKAIEIDPSDHQFYSGLGICYRKWGKYTKAAVAYQRALSLNPGDLASLNGLVKTYWEEGELARAEVVYTS